MLQCAKNSGEGVKGEIGILNNLGMHLELNLSFSTS